MLKVQNYIKEAKITSILIALNILMYIISILYSDFPYYLLASYSLVFESKEFYRLISALFGHIGLWHLLPNMLCLLLYGYSVELKCKEIKKSYFYLVIYFVSGILCCLCSILLNHNMGTIGASGAVYSLVTFYITTEKANIPTFIFLFVFLIGTPLLIPNADTVSHVVGFMTGIAFGLYYLNFLNKNT